MRWTQSTQYLSQPVGFNFRTSTKWIHFRKEIQDFISPTRLWIKFEKRLCLQCIIQIQQTPTMYSLHLAQLKRAHSTASNLHMAVNCHENREMECQHARRNNSSHGAPSRKACESYAGGLGTRVLDFSLDYWFSHGGNSSASHPTLGLCMLAPIYIYIY